MTVVDRELVYMLVFCCKLQKGETVSVSEINEFGGSECISKTEAPTILSSKVVHCT